MAKSLRSKRKRKLRALRREKFKPKFKQQLIAMLQSQAEDNDISDPMPNQGQGQTNQPLKKEDQDITMETEEASNANEQLQSEVSALKKLNKVKLPKHLMSQRKLRKLNLKEKTKRKLKKGGGRNKNKALKW